MQAIEITTHLGPRDQTTACGSGIKSPWDRMAAEKRRWRRMIKKAKAYLSKASAYGGGNSDERGNLPSLPVLGFPLTRASRLLGCQRAGARDRKKTLSRFHSSERSGVAFRKCLCNFFLKATSNSTATASNKGHKGNWHPLLLLCFFSCPSLLLTPSFRFLSGRSSLRAPLRGGSPLGGTRVAGTESSHGVLGLVVKVTRVRQLWSWGTLDSS